MSHSPGPVPLVPVCVSHVCLLSPVLTASFLISSSFFLPLLRWGIHTFLCHPARSLRKHPLRCCVSLLKDVGRQANLSKKSCRHTAGVRSAQASQHSEDGGSNGRNADDVMEESPGGALAAFMMSLWRDGEGSELPCSPCPRSDETCGFARGWNAGRCQMLLIPRLAALT